MKPPYGVCKRHCRFWDDCRPIIEALEAYCREHGRPSPVQLLIEDGACLFFQARKPDKGEAT